MRCECFFDHRCLVSPAARHFQSRSSGKIQQVAIQQGKLTSSLRLSLSQATSFVYGLARHDVSMWIPVLTVGSPQKLRHATTTLKRTFSQLWPRLVDRPTHR
jgi:hypothetical protein